MKQKKFFFWKKKIQNGRLKKTEFFNHHQKLSNFHQNFTDWSLGQVVPKRAETAVFVVLALFWAYVGQSLNHIGWATSMPFTSINSTNPRANPWNFGGNCSAFGGGWKPQFFWIYHLAIFFLQFFLLHSHKKLVYIYRIARMGQKTT